MTHSVGRIAAIAAMVVAAAAAAVLLLGSASGGYRVRAVVTDAGQLVKGNLVQVGGVTIGKVTSIDLDDHNAAVLDLKITDDRFHPLHRGTVATIRNTSLSSVAGRVVAIAPGPDNAPPIPDGGRIPLEDTRPIVDLDAVINTLDARTRAALQDVVHGGATSYAHETAAGNAGLQALAPALSRTSDVLGALDDDRGTFGRAIAEASGVAGAVAGRSGDVERGIASAAAAADAVAGASPSLDATLRRAPAVLRRSNTTLVALRAALADLRPALRDSRPAAPRLAALLRGAAPLVHRGRPVVADLRALLPVAASTLRGLPALDAAARPALAASRSALDDSADIVSAARPYTPDVIAGLLNGFGGTTGGYYDANGHYVRIALESNLQSLAGLGSLLPTPSQGSGAALDGYRTGILARCPGAAAEAAPDGSNPWAPAEARCRPEDSPR